MNNNLVYIILGIVIGAAGALVATGIVVWLRAPSPHSPEASSRTAPHDKSLRLVPLAAGEWAVEMGSNRYRSLDQVRDAGDKRRVQSMLDSLPKFTGQPAAAARLPEAPPPGMEEVLRVWQSQAEGGVVVESRRIRYRTLDEVRDAGDKQRVQSVLDSLSKFAGQPAAATRLPEAPPGMEEALRVWRSQADGGAVVEFRQMHYRRLIEVTDATTGRDLLMVLAGLEAFAKGKPAVLPAVALVTPSAPVPSAPTVSSAPSAPVAPATPPSVEEEFLRSLIAPPPKPASKVADAPPVMGIAGQIERVLQQQLQSRSDMFTRSIHMGTAPDGSLRVEVDGRFYPGIDQVPELAVRELLQAAVKEWEQST